MVTCLGHGIQEKHHFEHDVGSLSKIDLFALVTPLPCQKYLAKEFEKQGIHIMTKAKHFLVT